MPEKSNNKSQLISPKHCPLITNHYDYCLPNDRIAKYPLKQRDLSKLLIYKQGQISQSIFKKIENVLTHDSLLVFNNTKVINARLQFKKNTGALIEVFCLKPCMPADYESIFSTKNSCRWFCMVGNLKRWKSSTLQIVTDSYTFTAERIEEINGEQIVEFTWGDESTFAEILEKHGILPIPPYLNRSTESADVTTYQTVYSKYKGSVAAPTAGLHFTKQVLENIAKKGIKSEEVTLHVGAGTFKPVFVKDARNHTMHQEFFSVKASSIKAFINNKNIFAVGTTSLRTLESLYWIGCKLENSITEQFLMIKQWENETLPVLSAEKSMQNILNYLESNDLDTLHASTQIMIIPGYKFKMIMGAITNFHQPKSTLLLLISALVGDDWRKIYDYALSNDFRFLSYGDSSVIFL